MTSYRHVTKIVEHVVQVPESFNVWAMFLRLNSVLKMLQIDGWSVLIKTVPVDRGGHTQDPDRIMCVVACFVNSVCAEFKAVPYKIRLPVKLNSKLVYCKIH